MVISTLKFCQYSNVEMAEAVIFFPFETLAYELPCILFYCHAFDRGLFLIVTTFCLQMPVYQGSAVKPTFWAC